MGVMILLRLEKGVGLMKEVHSHVQALYCCEFCELDVDVNTVGILLTN